MTDQPAKLTDLPELSAYVLAHAAGLIWGFTVNPQIFRALVAEGYRNFVVIGVGLSAAILVVVLLIFLLLRLLMATAASTPRQSFTDLPELGAYVIAHVLGILFAIFVSGAILRSLYSSGDRNLMPVSVGMSIASAVVVLLIFLFLRRTFYGSRPPG